MKTKINTQSLKMFFVLLAMMVVPVIVNAGNPKLMAGLKAVFVVTSLAPVTPTEADFNDIPPINDTYLSLQPVTPKTASFDDSGIEAYDSWNLVRSLIPVVPAEAGFNEDEKTTPAEMNNLAPTLPAEANYDDAF
jgi:hypothetical protein